MWRLGIKNSYTLEATFGGSTLGKYGLPVCFPAFIDVHVTKGSAVFSAVTLDDRKGTHFTTGDLKLMGFFFCDTLLDFCDPDQTKARNEAKYTFMQKHGLLMYILNCAL